MTVRHHHRFATAVAVAVAALCWPALDTWAAKEVPSENPARTPFWAAETSELEAGFAGKLGVPLFSAPAGQRAVVEFVSFRCVSPPGNPFVRASINVLQLLAPTSTATRAFEVPLRFQGNDPFEGATYVGALTTRLYADAPPPTFGSSLTVNFIRENGTGTGRCHISVNGHLVTL